MILKKNRSHEMRVMERAWPPTRLPHQRRTKSQSANICV